MAHVRTEPDRSQPGEVLALVTESGDHLLEREDQVDVVGLTAQLVGQLGQHLTAPQAQEVTRTSARGKPVSRAMVALRLDRQDVAADDVAHDRAADVVIRSRPTVGVNVAVEEQLRFEQRDQPVQCVEPLMSGIVAVTDAARWRVGEHDVDATTVASRRHRAAADSRRARRRC